MKRPLAFSILLFIVGSTIFTGKPSESQLGVAGNPIVHSKFNVSLYVDCRYHFGVPTGNSGFDEATYKQVVSYIRRELRSFSDVDIDITNIDKGINDPDDPTHGIHIQTVNRLLSDEMIIVITFVEYINREKYLAAYLPEKTVKKIVEKEDFWLIFHTIWKDTYTMYHNTKTGDLSKLCKQIIVDFDTEVLENARLKR
ncbi:hypothetical protein C6501_10470 [Candidatus Poribacteria bacterium]|nr:MAG: hypothetical protein C6501_10470 [Candidatus Poribacteria bacterium]